MNNSNILLLCPCKRELLKIQSLNKESSSISLSYLGKSHTKEISIENYYTQLLSKRKEELCSFSKHKDKLIGSIYCCKCNCWLCDECLTAHNALQIGHLFTYTVLDCFDYCTNHNMNVASFYCETCAHCYCNKCSKEHKKHSKLSYLQYKDKILNNNQNVKI